MVAQTSTGWDRLPAGIALRYVGVIACGIPAVVPSLRGVWLAVIVIRIIAQPGKSEPSTKENPVIVEAAAVEPAAEPPFVVMKLKGVVPEISYIEIEPVTVDVFLRFLTRHHGLLPGSKRSGTSGLFETLSMLQGIDLPAVVWERDVLPRRTGAYSPAWLDSLCASGELVWVGAGSIGPGYARWISGR